MKVRSADQMGAAELVPALLAAEVGGPAVVHQDASKAGDQADRLDGCLAALGKPELQRQLPIGEHMHPMVLAVDSSRPLSSACKAGDASRRALAAASQACSAA